jgi:hypothetical protein
MARHCPITGRLLVVCDCGACDDLDESQGGAEDDRDEDEDEA